MDQKNELLNQTLIGQYSKLCYTSEEKLINHLKSPDWWTKESYRLKIQYKVVQYSSFLSFLCFCLVIILTSVKGPNSLGLYSLPLVTFAGFFFALFILLRTQSQTEEKTRLFELMKLQFNKNKFE